MQTFASVKKEIITIRNARKVFDLISKEMELVEAEYERQARSNIQIIDYLGEYLRSSGGKRVRPALLILSNYAAGGDASSENIIRMATVMEMLHTATLVHDDIIDNADVRRNRQTVNAKYGNQTAVLMGDWLYMSAFETSLRERSLDILAILTGLTRKMTEGELIQLTTLRKVDISEDEYYDILRRKTAYLFSACCEIGAMLAGSNEEETSAMRDFGMDLGIAFQLADDLLDLTSDQEVLGKAVAADLLEGKMTLPLIKLLQAEPELKPQFEQVMQAGEYTEAFRTLLTSRLSEHGSIRQVRDIANIYAQKARKNLEILPQTKYRVALDQIPSFVIDRNS
jgi:octaprenyl-diphosphate synthase